jgi:hypothetical protein
MSDPRCIGHQLRGTMREITHLSRVMCVCARETNRLPHSLCLLEYFDRRRGYTVYRTPYRDVMSDTFKCRARSTTNPIPSILATARDLRGTRGKPRRDHPEPPVPSGPACMIGAIHCSVREASSSQALCKSPMHCLVPGEETQQGYCD